jgi:hypothetical protein
MSFETSSLLDVPGTARPLEESIALFPYFAPIPSFLCSSSSHFRVWHKCLSPRREHRSSHFQIGLHIRWPFHEKGCHVNQMPHAEPDLKAPRTGKVSAGAHVGPPSRVRPPRGGGAEGRTCNQIASDHCPHDQIASDYSLRERTADIHTTNDPAAADVHVASQDADASPTDGEFASANYDGAGDCSIVQHVADVLQPFQEVNQSVTGVV